jgi:hypothetical protein
MIGVVVVCSLTAYNDFVVANTYLVGSALPLGLLLYFLVFILCINAPLHRWWPRRGAHFGRTRGRACNGPRRLRVAEHRADALSAGATDRAVAARDHE